MNASMNNMITHDHLLELYKEIYQPNAEELIQHNLVEVMVSWKKSYMSIKDKSWPECNTFEDFDALPESIRSECIDIHRVSPDIHKQEFVKNLTNYFELPPKDYQLQTVLENIDLVANKDIVDFACNFGGFSFACWRHGANSVVGFDIRDDNLKMAHALQEYYQVPLDRVKFIKLDIHDYTAVTELCKNKYTAFVPGVLYHVHDHYQILSSIAESKVPNIIIETAKSNQIKDSADPLIWWKIENTYELVSGWTGNHANIPVGYPNCAWFELIMEHLGYQLISKNTRPRPGRLDRVTYTFQSV
jgi:2-polyprenyl-3-methyl-5-hydroxy-6-metoxy-1,4-benzoquinol methylase